MAIDFFGVSLSGRIIKYPDGTGGREQIFELWTKPQKSNRFEFPALSYVSQVNMELTLGDNAKLSVVLTPPFEEGLHFMQSDLIRHGTGRLEVELGYTTGTKTGPGATQFQTLPFFGLMQKPEVSIGSDITITLHALGVGYAMQTVGGSTERSYQPDQSPADVVQQVLKKYVDGKYTALNIDSLYDNVTQAQKDNDPFFKALGGEGTDNTQQDKTKSGAPERPIRLEQGPRNDWWFIRETIENYGYDLFIQGNKAFICKKSDWLKSTKGFGDNSGPRKHFKLKGNVDPANNMYPILSFQSPTEGVWMPPGTGRFASKDVKSDKSGESSFFADIATTAMTWLKDNTGFDPDKSIYTSEPSETSKNMPGDPDSPAAREKAASEWRSKNMTRGTNGEFQTIGVPSLRPGEVVQVSGFEPRGTPDSDKVLFNGPYGVINVRHAAGVGGFTTNFLGVMNFFPSEFKEAAKKGKGDKVDSEDLKKSSKAGDSLTKVAK